MDNNKQENDFIVEISAEQRKQNQITKGMIVRYAPEWCSEGERKCRMVVLESYPDVQRCLIRHLNSNMVFAPTEIVSFEMIIPMGVKIKKST